MATARYELTKVINCHAHPHSENEVEEKRELWDSMHYVRTCASGNNAIVTKWIERYPNYVIGLWRFNAKRGAEQLDEARDLGFRGVKIIDTPLPYSHEDYFPLYAKCQDFGFPILFHTGILAILDSRQENFRPVYLGTICGAFPELRVIGAHFGLQWYWEAIFMARAYKNLFFDLSGGSWRFYPLQFFRHWFERVERNQVHTEPHMDWSLAKKLMYGSDNPDDTLEFYENLLNGLQVPHDVQDKIYFLNACNMFGLDPNAL